MKLGHPTYRQLLKKHQKSIKSYFDVDFLVVPGESLKLSKWTKILSPAYPTLMLMAGCHGEEPAPVLALFKNVANIAKAAEKAKVNLVVYPLVNPWGFDRDIRENRQGINCNRNWIQMTREPVAKEIPLLRKDMQKYTPRIFASMHEDDEIRKGFYIFTYGDKKYEAPLLRVGKAYFPTIQNLTIDDAVVQKSIVYNHHDGTAEDMMSQRGVVFSCCTETSSFHPLSKRMQCATDWVLKLIQLTAKNVV